jgi:hypothetical protein
VVFAVATEFYYFRIDSIEHSGTVLLGKKKKKKKPNTNALHKTNKAVVWTKPDIRDSVGCGFG